MNTYSGLYLSIRKLFREHGLPSPDLEARELVCFVSRKKREDFARDGGLYVSGETEARVRELAERHLNGEPVAYIIGEWDFYGLTLNVTPDVLIPRPDTETLALQAIRFLRTAEKKRALDLCAGNGCVGFAIASQVPRARVVLGELYDGALRLCHSNNRRTNLSKQVVPMKVDALEAPERVLGTFSCIVCNPPYIPTGDIELLDPSVRDFEPHAALDGGKDGLLFYRVIAEKWRPALEAGGRLMFEVGFGQDGAVQDILSGAGFQDIEIVPDTNRVPRVVCGTLPAAVPWDGDDSSDLPLTTGGTRHGKRKSASSHAGTRRG